jgi:hypothetical protein
MTLGSLPDAFFFGVLITTALFAVWLVPKWQLKRRKLRNTTKAQQLELLIKLRQTVSQVSAGVLVTHSSLSLLN